jgi:hypothetical protein
MKDKNGRIFHKSPKLLPANVKNLSHLFFIDFDMKSCILKEPVKNSITGRKWYLSRVEYEDDLWAAN